MLYAKLFQISKETRLPLFRRDVSSEI